MNRRKRDKKKSKTEIKNNKSVHKTIVWRWRSIKEKPQRIPSRVKEASIHTATRKKNVNWKYVQLLSLFWLFAKLLNVFDLFTWNCMKRKNFCFWLHCRSNYFPFFSSFCYWDKKKAHTKIICCSTKQKREKAKRDSLEKCQQLFVFRVYVVCPFDSNQNEQKKKTW